MEHALTEHERELRRNQMRRYRKKRALAQERAERVERHDERLAVWAAATTKASVGLAGLGKLYDVVVPDPPWDAATYSDKGKSRHASRHYPTMPTDAIAAIEVPAAPDAVLGLWVTIQMLLHGQRVMAEWGFTYKTAYGWMKPGIGHGYWSAKDQLELLLIGTRGRLWVPPVRGLQPPQTMRIELPGLLESAPLIIAPRGAHSAKPDIFYDELAKMFPGVPKLEMFARGPREGWDVWGDQSHEASGRVKPRSSR